MAEEEDTQWSRLRTSAVRRDDTTYPCALSFSLSHLYCVGECDGDMFFLLSALVQHRHSEKFKRQFALDGAKRDEEKRREKQTNKEDYSTNTHKRTGGLIVTSRFSSYMVYYSFNTSDLVSRVWLTAK